MSPRCGCSNTICSCSVSGSSGITVTGSGSLVSPYVVNARLTALPNNLELPSTGLLVQNGTLGFAQITASTAAISADTDIPGLSVTVIVGAGRRILISCMTPFDRTVADGLTRIHIKEGATNLQNLDGFVRAATEGAIALQGSVVLTPSAGTHTYKLSIERLSGTGTTRLVLAVGQPAHILVEDIGV